MKIVAALACRSNSSRLYGKPLQILGNLNVLEYIIKRLKEQSKIDNIVLAISEHVGNEAYAPVAKKNGIDYLFGDDLDVTGRLIKAAEMVNADCIFRITTESPFCYYEGINDAVTSHQATGADYTTYAKLPDGVTFELISLRALKISHNVHNSTPYRNEMVSLFIMEEPALFKFNILAIDKKWERPDYRLTIDYPEDLILCRKIISHFGEEKPIDYKDLMVFLDNSPELRSLVHEITDPGYLKPNF